MRKITVVLFILLACLIYWRSISTDTPKKTLQENPPESPKLASTHQNLKPLKLEQVSQRSAPQKVDSTTIDPDLLVLDENQSLAVSSFMVVDDYAIGFGDILVAPVEEILELERTNQQPLIPKPRTWPGGVVPYVIDPEVEQEQLIKNVIKYFNQNTSVRFVERLDEEDYVNFVRTSEHCFAHLGRIGGQQKVALSELCYEREIAHELMHTLGFIHEQNRQDRDDHIQIFWKNIDDNFHEQFKKIPSAYSPIQQSGSFSFDTVMIYHPFAFALDPENPTMLKKDGQFWSPIREILGVSDIERIQLIYAQP